MYENKVQKYIAAVSLLSLLFENETGVKLAFFA